MANISKSYERDLDLNLLRIFLVVSEEGSMTRAASRLYVTQPAISAAMGRLTAFVGAELFTRQGRGLVLTSRGAELARTARTHLEPLVLAASQGAVFDPATSVATVRFGLADSLEGLLLPPLLARLRHTAPDMRLIVVPVQFRTVQEALLSNRADLAVSIADELPRSILRQLFLIAPPSAEAFVCLFDPRFTKLPAVISERDYFAHEHVVVSYAGDFRGIVEDSLGKTRKVRVSVPTFSHVADIIDGSPLLATVPALHAHAVVATRPHLRIRSLPFRLDDAQLELLWPRVADEDPVARFVRQAVIDVGKTLSRTLPKTRARARGRRA